jgi:hypothetical protein
MKANIKPLVDLFKKPSITEVSIVYEHGDRIENTLLFGLEKSTSRLWIFEFNEYIGEAGDWMAGRFLTFDGDRWVSYHTSPATKFDTYEEIADYWKSNMVLHKGPEKGTKEFEDSILNSYICEMSDGMSSLSHVG